MQNTVILTSNILKTLQTLEPYILAPALHQQVLVLNLPTSSLSESIYEPFLYM